MREFGELETAIMEVMWSVTAPMSSGKSGNGCGTAGSCVHDGHDGDDILHRKGVLRRDKLGRAWQYWPVEAREDHDARLMAEVLRSGGDENATMRRFWIAQRRRDGEPVQRAGDGGEGAPPVRTGHSAHLSGSP